VHVLVQLLGAVAVLAAFAFAQVGVLDQRARAYLTLNLVGASVLAVEAWLGAAWGFLLLEGVWALVSAWSLTRAS
jgi:DMSO reductase anchor subunit